MFPFFSGLGPAVAAVFLAAPTPPAEGSPFGEALSAVRAGPADLDLRPSRAPTRMTLPVVEAALEDPAHFPLTAARRAGELRAAAGLSGLLALAAEELGSSASATPAAAPGAPLDPKPGIAPNLLEILGTLAGEVDRARPSLDRAVRSLSPDEREALVASMGRIVTNELGAPPDGPLYDAAQRFDLASLLQAAAVLTRGADRAVARLRALGGEAEAAPRVRWKRDGGDVLISGIWSETFTAADLSETAVLVHFGGTSRYLAAPAAAASGSVRIVVDFSRDVVVESSGAASGVFGVGLLYLPAAEGKKALSGGDVSLGAGLFGVGGLSASGPVELRASGFAEGAGAFGVGLLDSSGARSVFEASFAGQGFGFTRGVGIFRHRGDEAALTCGVAYPDPHEPQAAISLCQGVGFGPRAFAAGGLGLAVLEGDRSELRANYQSQGSGYWHGLGSLAVFGDENRLRARRYGQGAGIHAAAGALTLRGNRNRTIHWGVGPAFGWDYGVGSLDARGDDNSFFATWGTGRGDADGHGLAYVKGDRNRLLLPDLGSGYMRRFAPGYGLAVVEGLENRYRVAQATSPLSGPLTLSASPWGVLRGDAGLLLDPSLPAPDPQWPDVDREPRLSRERQFMGRLLREADEKRGAERTAGWLSVLAMANLDGNIPASAALRLLSLSPQEAEWLAGRLSVERFDETIWARTILASFGEAAAAEVIRELARASGAGKALLLSQLAYAPAADAIEPALAALEDPDWRVRRQAVGVLGYLFGRESGDESGRMRFLEEAIGLCSRPSGGALDQPTLDRIADKRLADLYAVLALDPSASADERAGLFRRTPNPFDTVLPDSINEFAKILAARGERCKAPLAEELDSARRLSGRAREAVAKTLRDRDRGVRAAAFAALGALGDAGDVPALSAGLADDSAEVREAAALGLGKMGAAAATALDWTLRKGSPADRAMAALAAAQSSDAAVFDLLHQALLDADPDVRRTALAGLVAAQRPVRARRREFVPDLRRLLAKDPAVSVRATAAYLEPQFR